MECECNCANRINLEDSQFDLDTFWGRARHCYTLRNPFYLLCSKRKLEEAKCLVLKYKCGEVIPYDVTDKDLWKAKYLYESAYHPHTSEKLSFFGRSPSQVPVNAFILGGMMTFYQKLPHVIIWQWLNQSYVALYNGLRAPKEESSKKILTSYVFATTVAISTAVALGNYVRCMPPIVGRLVPFAAVSAATTVGVPMIRAQELRTGTAIYDDDDNRIAYSKVAAQKAVGQSVLNKILWVAPAMLSTPIMLDYLEKRGTLCRYPWLAMPASMGLVALTLGMISPFACALFREKATIPVKHLERDIQCGILKKFKCDPPRYVNYYKET